MWFGNLFHSLGADARKDFSLISIQSFVQTDILSENRQNQIFMKMSFMAPDYYLVSGFYAHVQLKYPCICAIKVSIYFICSFSKELNIFE